MACGSVIHKQTKKYGRCYRQNGSTNRSCGDKIKIKKWVGSRRWDGSISLLISMSSVRTYPSLSFYIHISHFLFFIRNYVIFI
jgi:hypothetical protein